MSDRWFRLPEIGTGASGDLYRPDTKGHSATVAGVKAHPQGSPVWVARVYADEATLDALAAETGVVEYTNVPTDALNKITGKSRSASEWDEMFQIK